MLIDFPLKNFIQFENLIMEEVDPSKFDKDFLSFCVKKDDKYYYPLVRRISEGIYEDRNIGNTFDEIFIKSHYRYVLGISEIQKIDQPEDLGFRPHKWGNYIGNKLKGYEYLIDEPNIESILVFQFYQINS